MIIDTHVHLLDQPGYEHHLAKAARENGVAKLVLTGGPKQYDYASNDAVLAAAERYPDLFLPFAYFRLGRDYPALVDELHTKGFYGLQFALPEKDYDDKEFYLVYARAGQLGMPGLFQLGLIPNSGRDHLHNVCSHRMRPIYLDTIARAFPEFTIIGTRLGSPWVEEACEVARCNSNVYLDLSGPIIRRKGPQFFREMLWWGDVPAALGSRKGETPWQKIVFGSDVNFKYLSKVIREYEVLLEGLGAPDEVVADVFAMNAIRALDLQVNEEE